VCKEGKEGSVGYMNHILETSPSNGLFVGIATKLLVYKTLDNDYLFIYPGEALVIDIGDSTGFYAPFHIFLTPDDFRILYEIKL
jgi:hypothetical protein